VSDGSCAVESKTVEVLPDGSAGKYPRVSPASGPNDAKFVDLNSDDSSTIYQTLTVQRNTQYILSMWVSADYSCQGNSDDPNTKSATVSWDDQELTPEGINVDVTGWGNTGYRWKLFSWEVTAHSTQARVSIQSTSGGCGGIMIDDVSVYMAHAGMIDGIDGGECAVLGTDFTVALVAQETLANWARRDTYTMEQNICSVDGVWPEWWLCDTPTVGAITNAGGDRRYNTEDSSFVHVFGGNSKVLTQEEAEQIADDDMPGDSQEDKYLPRCSSFVHVSADAMAPWWNPFARTDYHTAIFAGPAVDGGLVTVFTYKLNFDHIATILNIKVTGAKFEGSVFRLSTHARTPIASREINVHDGHFAEDQCDRCGDCTVIVPGSRHHAETAYFFEEQSEERFGRIRASFCVRTPVCLLHGEHEVYNKDPHTHGLVDCGDDCECTDGLREHLDTYDVNFRTQIAEERCQRIKTEDPFTYYASTKQMGDSRSVRFGVKPKDVNELSGVVIGLHDYEQKPQVTPATSADGECSPDQAYYVSITDDAASLYMGLPGREDSTLLASNDQASGLLASETGSTKYFWVDTYYDEGKDRWSVRAGRDMGGSSRMETVVVGTDVFLQYDVPVDQPVIPVSHFAIQANEASEWHVCTHAEAGSPFTEKTCNSFGGCPCSWLDPDIEVHHCTSEGCTGGLIDGTELLQQWDNIPCSEQCGDGEKIRPTSCINRGPSEPTTLCRAKGTACQLFNPSTNPHCRVTLYEHHPHAYGHGSEDSYVDGIASRVFGANEAGNLNDQEFMGGCTVAMQALLAAQGEAPCTAKPTMDNQISSLKVEGPGCAVVFWEQPDGWGSYTDGGVADNSDPDDTSGWYEFRVENNKRATIVLNGGGIEKVDLAKRDPHVTYESFNNAWNDLFSSFYVTGVNPNYCTAATKPATQITCTEDRGCCWVAVHGMWHTGPANIQTGEEDALTGVNIQHFCMNVGNECDCDDEVGVECRDVRYERRKYTCSEWASSDNVDLWPEYYLNTGNDQAPLQQALLDWGDGSETPICKHKTHVQTHEISTDPHLTYTPLNRWQFVGGCPEPNHGLPIDQADKNLGSTIEGSMDLTTNEFFGIADKANNWFCSGDAYWFNNVAGGPVVGGEQQQCGEILAPSPETEATTGGLYPQQCQNCGKSYTEHWCTCQWHKTPWSTCEGCGDVLQFRDVDCRREDDNEGDRIRDCTQTTLSTYGSCCYSPLFYSACGGCTESEKPTSSMHCVSTSACNYEWHVKTGEEECDTFKMCVPYTEWTIDDRAASQDASLRKSWCTAGPQRTDKDNSFVTYGLGACWLPTTQQHNPSFTTSNAWAVHNAGASDCECYYGDRNFFGTTKMEGEGIYEMAAKSNKRYASRFDLHNAAWVTEILVATKDGAGATLKGAIYTDELGSPGTRVAVTEVMNSRALKGWVEMPFAQFVPGDATNQGVYLGGGSYWLSVSVGGEGTTFLKSNLGTMLTVDESFQSNNAAPAYDFGSGTTDTGSISVYATYTPDPNVHVEKLYNRPCTYSSSDCQTCMATQDNRAGYAGPCVWLTRDNQKCEPRDYSMTQGWELDLSCHADWGASMFTELPHWACSGQEAVTSNLIDNNSNTEENCAENCKLANRHWAGWTGTPSVVPDSVETYYCAGFTWEENESRCTMFTAIEAMENIVIVDDSEQLSLSTSERCYVPSDNANPCAFASGEWIRDQAGDYYFVGAGSFLYSLDASSGSVPTCDGVSVFGAGRTLADGPPKFCNGYYEGVGNNPPDTTCARCLTQAINHNMVAGTIDGSASTCGNFARSVKRVCQGQTMTLTCVRGAIDVSSAQATYGRMDEQYCSTIPVSPDDGSAMFSSATQTCGSAGNVQDEVFEQCNGKLSCSVLADDETFEDQGCPNTYKYLEVTYKCI